MPLSPILAQIYGPQPNVESVLGFVFPTIAFLLLCGAVLRWGRTQASKLLALGTLVAIAGPLPRRIMVKDFTSGRSLPPAGTLG